MVLKVVPFPLMVDQHGAAWVQRGRSIELDLDRQT
jgi:hypothetical protein